MIHYRSDKEVRRVMDELGFDEHTARRHVQQRRMLHERLREQSRAQVRDAIDRMRPLQGR